MSAKDAVQLSDNKISPSTLSKLLVPTGQIRYMRKGHRCKVHVADFVEHLQAMTPAVSEDELSEMAAAFVDDVEKRTNAERAKKDSRQ